MPKKNSAAVELGRKGGKATANNRTRAERVAAAKKAIRARWDKKLKEAEETVERLNKEGKELLKKSRKRPTQR